MPHCHLLGHSSSQGHRLQPLLQLHGSFRKSLSPQLAETFPPPAAPQHLPSSPPSTSTTSACCREISSACLAM